ncbi:hypothetical protein MTO96_051065 [Rhipicephalus appendiculatus]
MSLSNTDPCGDEDLDQLFVVLATQQTALRQKDLQILRLQEQLEALDDDITNEERRCRVLAATAARLCFRERNVWSYPRAQCWYEETLPRFPGQCLQGKLQT